MSRMRWGGQELPRLDGKTVVVTGASSGLGLESARHLARSGATVVMACRNAERAGRAVSSIRSTVPTADLDVLELDLANLTSVRSFTERLSEQHPVVDVLMNNAGVMAVDSGRTVDGFETQFGTNHLGHFALTGLLLPQLMANPSGARIVNVSSMGHRAGRLDLRDPNYDARRYQRWGAYFQSKLANLLFTAELQRRLVAAGSTAWTVAAHPGSAATDLGKVGSSPTNWVIRQAFSAVVRGPDAGSLSQVIAAVAPDVRPGGLIGPRWMMAGAPSVETPSKRARDEELARELWRLSERLTGVAYPV